MKISKPLFLAPFIAFSLFTPINGYAQEMPGSHEDTPIKIELIQSPIHLIDVTPPTFGTYEITNKSQEIQATGDLVVTVQDTRTETLSPWKLDYEIATFSDSTSTNQVEGMVKFKLGAGTLSIDGQAADKTIYQSKELELGQEKKGTLMQTSVSSTSMYEYRIPKEKISITLPANSVAGKYTTMQTLILVSLPESE